MIRIDLRYSSRSDVSLELMVDGKIDEVLAYEWSVGKLLVSLNHNAISC